MSDVENLSKLANQLGTEIARSMGFAGVVLAILDYQNNLGICCSVSAAADKAQMLGIAKSIQNYTASVGAELEVHHTAECVHCQGEVPGNAAAIRIHATTCTRSPVVIELAAAKSRIAQLEVELADARSDRAEVVTTWTPAPKAEG